MTLENKYFDLYLESGKLNSRRYYSLLFIGDDFDEG